MGLRRFNAVSAALILSALLQGCAVDRASSTDDSRITEDVKKAIAQHADLGPPNQIYVATHNGLVSLSGIVDNGLVITNAKAVAGEVPGVRGVDSTISIDR